MKPKFGSIIAEIDEEFDATKHSLGDGKGSGPEENDAPAGAQDTVELAQDRVDLGMEEVLHDADVPDAVERLVMKGQPENVAADANVHHGINTAENRKHEVERDQHAAAGLVDQCRGFGGAGSGFDKHALPGKEIGGEVADGA